MSAEVFKTLNAIRERACPEHCVTLSASLFRDETEEGKILNSACSILPVESVAQLENVILSESASEESQT